jgi:hypothetical protein
MVFDHECQLQGPDPVYGLLGNGRLRRNPVGAARSEEGPFTIPFAQPFFQMSVTR